MADLEILLKACTSYGVSLPSYLVSVQDDVARTEALSYRTGSRRLVELFMGETKGKCLQRF